MSGGKWWRTREFSQLAGVSVRALHYYDEVGLLKPARTQSGYRLYGDSELERLEQIVALKFLGVPLKKIKNLLGRNAPELLSALRLQRGLLEEKQRLLDTAIKAIAEAELVLQQRGPAYTSILKRIIEVIAMQNNTDWMMKYFSNNAKRKVEATKSMWTPELQARAEADWSELFRDIRLSLDEDPSSPKAQALVERWNELIRAFTGDEPGVAQGVKLLYADRQNWPDGFREKMEPFTDERVWEFFRRAVAAPRSSVPKP